MEEERDSPARKEHPKSHGGGGGARSWNIQIVYTVVVIPYLHIKFDKPFSINVV